MSSQRERDNEIRWKFAEGNWCSLDRIKPGIPNLGRLISACGKIKEVTLLKEETFNHLSKYKVKFSILIIEGYFNSKYGVDVFEDIEMDLYTNWAMILKTGIKRKTKSYIKKTFGEY